MVNGGVLGDTTTQMLSRPPALLTANTPHNVLLTRQLAQEERVFFADSVRSCARSRRGVGSYQQAATGRIPR